MLHLLVFSRAPTFSKVRSALKCKRITLFSCTMNTLTSEVLILLSGYAVPQQRLTVSMWGCLSLCFLARAVKAACNFVIFAACTENGEPAASSGQSASPHRHGSPPHLHHQLLGQGGPPLLLTLPLLFLFCRPFFCCLSLAFFLLFFNVFHSFIFYLLEQRWANWDLGATCGPMKSLIHPADPLQ